MALADNTRGALLMSGSMIGFVLNDTCLKVLADDMPLMQVLVLRGIGMTLFLAAVVAARGMLRVRPSPGDMWLILLRTLSEVGAAYFFLTALFYMDLANISAIMQSLPLAVTLAAALFLGEPVGWRRFAAIGIGFLGVLLIVRPGGAGFTIHALYALGAVLCVTVRDLAARQMSFEVPSVVVALAASVGVTLFAAAGSAFVEWRPVTGESWLLILGAIVFVVAGYILSVTAMRVGEIGSVAPFRYTSLLAALILGALVFGTFPDGWTLAGAALVVGSGLFTLWRERRTRLEIAGAEREKTLGPATSAAMRRPS